MANMFPFCTSNRQTLLMYVRDQCKLQDHQTWCSSHNHNTYHQFTYALTALQHCSITVSTAYCSQRGEPIGHDDVSWCSTYLAIWRLFLVSHNQQNHLKLLDFCSRLPANGTRLSIMFFVFIDWQILQLCNTISVVIRRNSTS